MAEKCNNPIPGDLSTVHAGEEHVQTATAAENLLTLAFTVV